ncbi:MAG: DNA polymerase IV [Planctomycetota bacterium]
MAEREKSAFWPRAILHVDMDAFFTSVEALDNPALRGKPVIVGGTVESRGVVAAASYEARRYGVHSAMSMARAVRLCPGGVFLPPRGARYAEVSRRVREIFERFTPLVEPVSVDEAFLDVTGSQRLFGFPLAIARRVKDLIREETGLTASVGVAGTRFVAKLASDLEKPDGLVVIPDAEVLDRLAPLDASRLPGVGGKTVAALARLGIRTIGDLRAWPEEDLADRFGAFGEHLHALSLGRDSSEVAVEGEAKSVSNEHTFAEDVRGIDGLLPMLHRLADKVAGRMRAEGVVGRVVTLKLRYGNFDTVTRRRTLPEPSALASVLAEEALALLRGRTEAAARPVRLLGVGMSGLSPEDAAAQRSLFTQKASARTEALERAADSIRKKMGRDAIVRAVYLSPKRKKAKGRETEEE